VSDVNANINIGVNATSAIESLRQLQGEINAFNKAVLQTNASAAASQKNLVNNFASQVGAIGQFSTSVRNVESSVSRLGSAIDKSKLSLGEYFKYGIASTQNFGKVFSQQHNDIMALAEERVKKLQTQYVALGQAQNGFTKTLAIQPMHLQNQEFAVGIQRQQIFNKLLSDGSTSMINWGKNTQWAGRQLMVGFSVPLAAFGAYAAKTFMQLDQQARDFKRVYGDITTPAAETQKNLDAVKALGVEYTKYGISLQDTMKVAADAAAAGFQNQQLTSQTEQSLRLATIGQIDYQKALTTTITLQTAFKLSNQQLAPTVDFIGAVANQTVLTVDDLTSAIPRVAPVIQGLGGNVKDLAVMLVAMKAGGVSAEQGANALKSGLASLINPTKAATTELSKYHINLQQMVQENKGNLMGLVTQFGASLEGLNKFDREQVLAKVFGKYQFARIGALFDGLNQKTGQVAQAMQLLGMNTQQLATMSDKSLSQIEQSTTAKFQGAVEKLKIAIAPIGEMFLKIVTPVLTLFSNIFDKINSLSPGVKNFITILIAGFGLVVPALIMGIGLFGNFAGNIVKGISIVNNFFNRIKDGGSIFKYMKTEELDAAAAAASLEGKTTSLTESINIQKQSLDELILAYQRYAKAATSAAENLPTMLGSPVRKMATGGIVPGSGNGDTIPAMLTPGETVITKQATQKYGPILSAMNSGNLPGYASGVVSVGGGFSSAHFVLPKVATDEELSEISKNATPSAQRAIEAAKAAGKSVKVYTNEVVNVSQELNSALNAGTATFGMAKKDLIENSAFAHGELELQLKKAGVDPVSIKSTVEQITQKIGQQLSKQKDNIILTEENFGKIVTNAYDEVAASGSDAVKQARLAMSNPTSITDPASSGINPETGSRVRGRRISLGKFFGTAYRAESRRKQYKAGMVSVGNVPYYLGPQQIDLAPMASELNVETDKVVEIWKKLDVETKIRLASISKNFSQFTSEFAVEATKMGESLGNSAIGSINSSAQTQSPSKKTKKTGKDITDGLVVGMKEGEQSVIDQATQVGEAATKAIATAQSGKPIMAFGMAGSALYASSANMPQTSSGIIAENTPKIPNKIVPFGLPGGQGNIGIASGLMAAQEKALSGEITATEEVSNNSKNVSSKMKMGAGKMIALSTGLDTVTLGLSMMNNSVGQVAQSIMPFIFGAQGIAALFGGLKVLIINQMISTGAFAVAEDITTAELLGFAASMALAAAPFLAAAAVIGGVIAAMVLWRKSIDNAIAAGKKLGDAEIITANELQGAANYYGNTLTIQKQTSSQFKQYTGLSSPQLDKAQGFLQTESGKAFSSEAQASLEMGAQNFVDTLSNKLTQMVVSNAISPDQAKSLAYAISNQLGQTKLTPQILGKITSMIGPDGKDIYKDPVTVYVKIEQSSKQNLQTLITNMQEAMANNGGLGSTLGFGGNFNDAVKATTAYQTAAINFANQQKQNDIQANQALQSQIDKLETIKNKRQLTTKEAEKLKKLQEDQSSLTQKEADARNQFLKNSTSDAIQSNNLYNPLGANARNAAFDAISNANGGIDAYSIINSLAEKAKGGAIGTDNATQVQKLIYDVQTKGINISQLQTLLNTGDNANNVTNLVLNLEQTGDVKGAQKTLDSWYSLDTQGRKNLDIVVKKQANITPEEIDKYTKALGAVESVTDDKLKKTIYTEITKANVKDLTSISDALDAFSSVPTNFRSKITIDSNDGEKRLENLVNGIKIFNKTPSPMKRAQIIFGGGKDGGISPQTVKADLKAMGMSLDDFSKKPNSFKFAVMAAIQIQDASGKQMNPTQLQNYLKSYADAFNAQDIQNTLDTKNPKPPKDPNSTSGGSKSLTTIQQFIADAAGTANTYPAMINKIKGKFGNIPQAILDAIGTGDAGLKNAEELYKMSSAKMRKLVSDYTNGLFGTTMYDVNKQIALNQQKARVATSLMMPNSGFDKNQRDFILSNDALVMQADTLKKGSTQWKQFVENVKAGAAAQKALAEATMTASEKLQSEMSDSQTKIGEFTTAVDAAFKALDDKTLLDQQAKFLEANGMTTNQMQLQVKINDEQIQQQQDLVDAKQKQIDSLTHENNLTQQGIDDLNRQVTIRDRVSSALTHDLDIMSQQETVIKTAYDKRLKALDAIAAANQHILDIQNSQLNISKALSTGDIYAAAQAQQQMQASQVQYATNEVRTGMQNAMQNQIDALKTPGGLTRLQAEQQISNIKEQDYQTTLQVTAEEDKIYNNNLKIRDLNSDIYDIQHGTMETLQLQNKQYQELLTNYSTNLEVATAINTVNGYTHDQWDNMKTSIDQATNSQIGSLKKIADAWLEAAAAVRSYNDATGNHMDISGASGISNATTPQTYTSNGQTLLSNGMGLTIALPGKANGGMIRGYANGGGHPAMDSVLAMLMPGEFVMRKAAVDRYGMSMLSAMNQNSAVMPGYSFPGSGGSVRGSASTKIHAPVYNTYSVSVPVTNPGASADEIANVVMTKIRNVDNSSIRRINGY
jgi:hypothetical protein